jgi:serine/threonine-protein kinase HipA
MRLRPGTILDVALEWARHDVLPVGRLALASGGAVLEYAAPFLASGLRLEPLGVYDAPPGTHWARSPRECSGLHGVFADSLPEGWGEMLLRKACGKAKPPVPFLTLSALDRLAWIGRRGQGALVYRPAFGDEGPLPIDVDLLAREAQEVIDGAETEVTDALVRIGGPSAGARPKALLGLRADGHAVAGTDDLPPGYVAWIVKFRSRQHDIPDIGPLEMTYADMARAAGLEMAECRLISARSGPGYFATRRFDRLPGGGRAHMLSLAAALEVEKDIPSIDYGTMLKVIGAATRNYAEVLKGFRRMVFNVAAYNRDDHLRQHALLMDRAGTWVLSPSYDLTFSHGMGGEHLLALAGEGRNPTAEHIARVAAEASIRPGDARAALEEVLAAVSRFRGFARSCGATRGTIADIGGVLDAQVKLLGAVKHSPAPARTRGKR